MSKFISDTLSLFIPPVFYRWKKALLPKRLVVDNPLPKRERKCNRLVLIGNGPSLIKTMDQYSDQLAKSECIMVNWSASSPLYEQIEPSIYVLSDANFAHRTIDEKSVNNLIDNIAQKTTWPLTIVVPDTFGSWWAENILCANPNINIEYSRGGWCEMYDEESLFRSFETNAIVPPSYTVLTFSLYLAIYWGYPEIYIVGADTSFIKDAYVDQQTNQLFTVDTHFYNNNEVRPEGLISAKQGRPFNKTMLALAEQFHSVMYEYNLLNRYAQWKGLKVYNASEFSMIDCFERKKL